MKDMTNFHLVFQPASRASASPYRLLDGQGSEVAWVNEFLDLHISVGFRLVPYAPMAMTCCTSPAGGRKPRRAPYPS
jgi:hypothetical protein